VASGEKGIKTTENEIHPLIPFYEKNKGNLSNHMDRQARTGDTVLLKIREMTGRTQTLPWWLGGKGGKGDRKQHTSTNSYEKNKGDIYKPLRCYKKEGTLSIDNAGEELVFGRHKLTQPHPLEGPRPCRIGEHVQGEGGQGGVADEGVGGPPSSSTKGLGVHGQA
jgi:hypothetical protein